MVLAGELFWAFDIGNSRRKQELRILALSVADYLSQSSGERPWEEVAEFIAPAANPVIRATDLAAAWSCKTDTIFTLVENRALLRVPGTDCRRGPGGSLMVQRESAIEFLESRRVG
jgi:hypothetical protein